MKFETTPDVDRQINEWVDTHNCTEGPGLSKVMYDFTHVGDDLVFSVACVCGADFFPVEFGRRIEPSEPIRDTMVTAIRSAYITGIHDNADGRSQWCRQGSVERAEEILQELIDDGEIEI